jgi:hypothetical protein
MRGGTYCIGGIDLLVDSADTEVAEMIDARLDSLRAQRQGSSALTFEIRTETDSTTFATPPKERGRPVYDAPGGEVYYYPDSDRLFVDYLDLIRVACLPESGKVESSIRSDDRARVLAAHPLFTIPLLELMKRRERFPLHAACVARDGRGLLLAGGSGSGKSTLALALARAGYNFLSDDMVFLKSGPDGLRAWGFPDEVDVTDATAKMFPELSHLVGRGTRAGRDKHAVNIKATFGIMPIAMCEPEVIVFPEVASRPTSQIEPMTSSSALRKIVPNVLLTEPTSSQAHLDVLASLVGDVPCFSLRTGEDLHEAVAVVGRLLA